MLTLTEKFSLLSTKEWLVLCSRMNHINVGKYLNWRDVFPFYLWNMWLTRVDNLFNNKKNPIPINLALDRVLEFKLLEGKHIVNKHGIKTETDHRWVPPTEGMKLNVNGSFDYKKNVGGAGGLIRDKHGNWVRGFSAKFTAQSPLDTETNALYLGLKIDLKHLPMMH